MPLLSIKARRDQGIYKFHSSLARPAATDNPVSETDILKYDDATLAFAYPRLPLRQTLDQYYYNHLSDTTDRDSSQVLLRAFSGDEIVVKTDNGHVLNKLMDYLREQWWPPEGDSESSNGDVVTTHEGDDSGNVIMVDQLWLWVIGEGENISSFYYLLLINLDTIITCFPSDLRDPGRDLSSFVDDFNQTLVLPGFPARDFAVRILKWSLTFATFQEQNYLAAFHRMIDETVSLLYPILCMLT